MDQHSREQSDQPAEAPVYTFPLDAFAQTCLLQGVDELGYLAARLPDIERYESTHAR